MGANAWAGTVTLFSQDYDLASTPVEWSSPNAAGNLTLKTGDAIYGNYVNFAPGNANSRTAYTYFNGSTSFFEDYKTYTLEFDVLFTAIGTNQSSQLAILPDGVNSTTNGSVSSSLFALSWEANSTTFKVNGSDTETVTVTKGNWNHVKLVVDGDAGSIAYTIIDKKTNTVILSGSSDIASGVSYKARGIHFLSGRYWADTSFDNISITTEVAGDVANVPTINLTGLNGTERTYTITYSLGETLHYVLPGGSEQTVTTGTSAVVSTSTSGTLRAWTTSGTATSDEVTAEVAAENVTLAAPWVYISGMAANETKYNAILNGGNSQEEVLLKPTATQTATFTPVDGVATNVSLPYTAEEKGVLTVTVSAEGYTSASTSLNIEGSYVQTWQSADFSSLVGAEAVQAALGGTWTLQDGHGRWASWNKDKDGTYNFYATNTNGNYRNFNDNIYFRDVVVLAEGMGLGRNVQGSEAISVSNTKANQVVGFEIYNGFGNDINKGTNTYMSYSLCDGINRPSMSSNNGALLVQVTIYSSATVAPAISAVGYATFASDYALDFTNATGVKAYKATGVAGGKVTMAQVTGTAAAGEGLFLQKTEGEIAIPVVATGDKLEGNLLVRGTGAAVEKEEGFDKYVLGAEGESVAFFLINEVPATVATDKAYLKVSTADAGSGSRLTLAFGGESTGIEAVAAEKTNGEVYNLNGQRVAAPQKGLFIMNGKKVIVK